MRRAELRWLLLATVLVSVLFVFVTPAFAQGGDGQFIFGRDFVLRTGERVDGALAVVGGSLITQTDSRVNGDVFVTGGDVEVGGTVNGNIAVFGGNVTLKYNAVVRGDVTSFGGQVDRAPGAVVRGNVVVMDRPFGIPMFSTWRHFSFPMAPMAPTTSLAVVGVSELLALVLRMIATFFFALAIGAISVIVVLLLEKPVRLAQDTLVTYSWPSLGMGLLTLIVVVAVGVTLTITICLSPVAFLLFLALLVALLYGWTVTGLLVGEKILEAFGAREFSPLLSVLLGVGLLTLLLQVPCIGWLMGLMAGAFGLGAVVMTRGGSTPYPQEISEPVAANGMTSKPPSPPTAEGIGTPSVRDAEGNEQEATDQR